jgi:predicted ATPase/DNA-binding SARP family transcriptional activator
MGSADGGDPNPVLEVRLLGGFEVRVGDRLVPASVWGQRRSAAIVKLLALEPGRRLHREQVLDVLWPDLDAESAANNLRVALHHARRGLEGAGAPAGRFLVREGDALILGPRDGVRIDVEEFAAAVAQAWQSTDPDVAEAAATLYRGELLPDDPYEDWAAARREAVRASYLTLLARLSGLHEERGDLPRALIALERALAVDALDEPTNTAIVRLHAAMGQRAAALAHYARFVDQLQRELGTMPERETRELAAAIREGRIPAVAAPAAPPPRTPSGAIMSPLLAAVDALIGRERELAELERLLAGSRLVTLTGPGGIGKTRLATEAARAQQARYPDGVAFVDLAALHDPTLVLPAVARALGVELSGGPPAATLLTAAIGERRLLLVCDNLEQVAGAGSDLASLLATCPNLALLATSRVRLRVRGEQEYPVPPLALPTMPRDGGDAPLSSGEQSPAVALFVRRAQAARPGFVLTTENVAAVTAICRRLDGLPLAIELAAARVRVLTPEELRRRLVRPLDVLGDSAADLPERQRTLRDTIAWSHALLTPAEQVLFRRLGIFAGGWTLAAAEAVSDHVPDLTALSNTPAVVELLAGLVDHSLVMARPEPSDGETRFTMLETIREFALERLLASGEAEATERALEALLIHLAEEAESGFVGPEQTVWLDRIQAEHDNIRAALGGSLDRGETEVALTLAPAITPFWRARGFAAEGAGWLERALALAPDTPIERRATALDALGGLLIDLGDYHRADRAYQESVDLWWQLGDRRAVMQGLYALATVRSHSGDVDDAQALLEEALAIARELDDERGVAASLHNLGMLAREHGDVNRAITLLTEAMTIWRGRGDAHWIGVTASNLGDAYRLSGDAENARLCFDEGASRYASLGDRFGLGVVANQRGLLAQTEGFPGDAMGHHVAALRHFDAIQAPLGVIESIEWLAVAAAHTPLAAAALPLFGGTATARAARGLTPLALDATPVAAGLELSRQAAGSGAEAALAAGAAMSLEESRDAALALAAASAHS